MKKPLWKDEWKPPKLKRVRFEGSMEVVNPEIATIEIWYNPAGYRVYYRRLDGSLDFSCGPYKMPRTAWVHAGEAKEALEA